ncbi:MAG TPA: DUF1579 domain-containing protein [Candidatus Synoicihabitans sp.]|nr:DUF1579 domain-containing protein [Candidatus Synoicihabitans sp.]
MSTTESTLDTPAAGPCEATPPLPQHAWLQRFVGDWDSDIEMPMDPGQPPMKSKGIDRCQMLGGYWLISEGQNLDFPYSWRLTLGYDAGAQRYVGTWTDTMSPHLWQYRGSVDATGRILTLETEGPFPFAPGVVSKFREVSEFVTEDHRVFTSSRLNEQGQWTELLRINFRRRR